MIALTVEQLLTADRVEPDNWWTFADDPKSHDNCALCCGDAEDGRPLLDAYLGGDEFKAHGDCAFVWAEKHNGRAAEVRS